MTYNNSTPDFLFEVSWEVCNKVGGIHTVLSTKALTLTKSLKDNYILIGPDVWKETTKNPEFIEEKFLYKLWREYAESKGVKFRIGRWNVAGSPIVILIDFTTYFALKDSILSSFWETYQLDSLSGQWDYVEPVIFGYAAAKVIENFYEFNVTSKDKICAQFHEWMTGSGVLYLKNKVPQIGTIFTTHATVLGRSIAGNSLPLYNELNSFVPDVVAKNYNVAAKQSLEKLAAKNSDVFTTVSEITSKECEHFLSKKVDIITPNGFENDFVPKGEAFDKSRIIARKKLQTVAEAVLNQKLDPDNTLYIANTGRYEFKNKGIDVFIKALSKLNNEKELKKTVVAYIIVPGNNAGPKRDVLERIHNNDYVKPITDDSLTHFLHDSEYDQIIKSIKENNLRNLLEDKVKIIFAPIYLNGIDGIFNLSYFDLIIGFDLTVFPSYYEPWGYTPMESLAFHIPTITTSLSGFGRWIKTNNSNLTGCVSIIDRDDYNEKETIEKLAELLKKCNYKSDDEREQSRKSAHEISKTVLWDKLIKFYFSAYDLAISAANTRFEQYSNKQVPEQTPEYKSIKNNKPQWKKILIKSQIPERLINLAKLSRNLWWCWNNDAIELFESINPKLWKKVQHNPVDLLEILSYEELLELENNKDFIANLENVYQKFDKYMKEAESKPEGKVAYFSMEYGLHDSVKIFSGGLGILAGDYLKEASDSNKNMIGIGLLYRYGYFTQALSPTGEQIAKYIPQKFTLMPVKPLRNEKGEWITISMSFPGRTIYAKAWELSIGRIPLYLLDTDIEANSDNDKSITHQLYGGDWENRLKQELVLGIGGIRLLEQLNIKPDLYHCNEGHAAFLTIERIRRLIEQKRLSYNEAKEVVRATTLFTTHTPVPAGHDAFTEDLLRTYIPHFAEKMNISWEEFINLGKIKENDINEKFSMSVLAIRLSQEVNGVSKIHGHVSRVMFKSMYEGYFHNEIHIGHVTNGVHFPTWISNDWEQLYNKVLGEDFRFSQHKHEIWNKIHSVDNNEVWKIRKKLKKELFQYIKHRLLENLPTKQENPTLILDMIEKFDDNILTIGFARRFATYKRAHLLFKNLKKLDELVNNPKQPVQFIFAGKAHPHDKAGQDLIKHIINVSRKPEFLGKIIFIENYDIDLAKKLIQGVDIWMNTPTRPLEASGTSGEKAVMNGVMNLSVLDGWWAEGYVPGAGWALSEEKTYQNQVFQDELDAEIIYNLIENDIAPKYYNILDNGVSDEWVSQIKNTISKIAPRFTMRRQLDDYYSNFYDKMFVRSKRLIANNFELAKNLSSWKKRIIRGWKSIELVSVFIPESNSKALNLGDLFKAEVILNLHELKPEEIGIEIVFGRKEIDEVSEVVSVRELELVSFDNGLTKYSCAFNVSKSGVYDYSFRIFPKHKDLPHRQDFSLLMWI